MQTEDTTLSLDHMLAAMRYNIAGAINAEVRFPRALNITITGMSVLAIAIAEETGIDLRDIATRAGFPEDSIEFLLKHGRDRFMSDPGFPRSTA